VPTPSPPASPILRAAATTTRWSASRLPFIAAEYVAAGELEPLDSVDWLISGAGAFEIGGPKGTMA
jgi:hypothetical protein